MLFNDVHMYRLFTFLLFFQDPSYFAPSSIHVIINSAGSHEGKRLI